jgi:hypothetical protein
MTEKKMETEKRKSKNRQPLEVTGPVSEAAASGGAAEGAGPRGPAGRKRATPKRTGLKLTGWMSFSEATGRGSDFGLLPKGGPRHEKILVQYLKHHPGKRISGKDHQYGPAGVPVFSDSRILLFTLRRWDELVAQATPEAASAAGPESPLYG